MRVTPQDWLAADESRIGLGCMRLSTEQDRDEARALATVHAALDGGATVFDTAHAYALDEGELGHNERLLALGGDRPGAAVSAPGSAGTGHAALGDHARTPACGVHLLERTGQPRARPTGSVGRSRRYRRREDSPFDSPGGTFVAVITRTPRRGQVHGRDVHVLCDRLAPGGRDVPCERLTIGKDGVVPPM